MDGCAQIFLLPNCNRIPKLTFLLDLSLTYFMCSFKESTRPERYAKALSEDGDSVSIGPRAIVVRFIVNEQPIFRASSLPPRLTFPSIIFAANYPCHLETVSLSPFLTRTQRNSFLPCQQSFHSFFSYRLILIYFPGYPGNGIFFNRQPS